MVLLDLSVSFDTIDHETFLERLRYRYGFSNLVLQWFISYLTDRPQHIVLDKFSSQPRRLLCGVPQGSVLGPVLFSLQISPLAHGLNAKMYADFSQLYIIVRQSNRTSATALQELALCIQDIFWNVCNMFIDNPKKTEILHLTFYTAPKPVPSIKIGDCSVTPSREVKGLGVTLDRHFTFKTHIDIICRLASRSIHQIGKIRNFLSRSSTERLIHAFFLSKLDSCNSILHGLPSLELEKLPRLQNTTARLTVRAKMSVRLTPV